MATRTLKPATVVPAQIDAPPIARAQPAESHAALDRGRELFLREWMPDDPRSHGGDGLGPVYNDSSCVACHNLGGVGGGGPSGKNVDILTSRSLPGAQKADGRQHARTANETPQKIHPGFQSATSVVLHRFGVAPDYVGWRLERLAMATGSPRSGNPPNLLEGPPDALARVEIEQARAPAGRFWHTTVGRSQRNPTALFGAGRIDAIPDRVIENQALRKFPEFPEIQGRVSRLGDGRVGRFGWKAQLASLPEFVLTACSVELGLEVPDHPQGGDPLVPELKAPGLDLTASECADLIAFVRSLPAPGEPVVAGAGTATGRLAEIQTGEGLFQSIGCGTCHASELGDVRGIYSDLLLHDMGPEGSDTGSYRVFRPEPASTSPDPSPSPAAPVATGPRGRTNQQVSGATEREWRTPPLWGLRDSAPYLHDGHADTLDQAIALHGGQGKASATRYFGLSPRRRQQVQAFLKSLVAPVGSPAS